MIKDSLIDLTSVSSYDINVPTSSMLNIGILQLRLARYHSRTLNFS
jgi:hypothetical protein